MYDNRQNNRFSIFIGAIVVSLLVLITGCSSAQKEINTDEPITEDSSNPVTLTVYLTAHYANPDTHCPIYEKLLDYQKENPNITIQFVSPKEGILTSIHSTAACATVSPRIQRSPTQYIAVLPKLRCQV